MVKLSWATKTFVPVQFYHLIPLLLQCFFSLFARSLSWLIVCLFVFFLLDMTVTLHSTAQYTESTALPNYGLAQVAQAWLKVAQAWH